MWKPEQPKPLCFHVQWFTRLKISQCQEVPTLDTSQTVAGSSRAESRQRIVPNWLPHPRPRRSRTDGSSKMFLSTWNGCGLTFSSMCGSRQTQKASAKIVWSSRSSKNASSAPESGSRRRILPLCPGSPTNRASMQLRRLFISMSCFYVRFRIRAFGSSDAEKG
jgi:hypothetical protein